MSPIPAEACLTFTGATSRPDPIVINGDSAFLTSPAVKGGQGTAGDPYRIKDLTIANPPFSAIPTSNTNLSFTVRNVTVTRGPPDPEGT